MRSSAPEPPWLTVSSGAVARLALADFRHDWRISLCNVVAVAAVLTPLLVLLALEHGVVTELRQRLASDPRNLELRHLGQGRFDQAWLEAAAKRPGVAFLLPRTRFLHTSVDLRNRSDPEASLVEAGLVPTGPGDPLLARAGIAAPTADGAVLSHTAAEALRVAAGSTIEMAIARKDAERREQVRLTLTVAGVLPLELDSRELALVPLDLLLAIEDYREWHAVPSRGWSGALPPRATAQRVFASFRLFAADLDSVEPLRAWLVRDEHLEVETAADRIATVKRLDRDLTAALAVISSLGLLGYALLLAINLIANVVRKRKELAVLRLVGFTTLDLLLFPLVQALVAAAAGVLLAMLLYMLVDPLLEAMLGEHLLGGGEVARLAWQHVLAALAGSLALAALAALWAGRQATRIQPAEVLHEI